MVEKVDSSRRSHKSRLSSGYAAPRGRKDTRTEIHKPTTASTMEKNTSTSAMMTMLTTTTTTMRASKLEMLRAKTEQLCSAKAMVPTPYEPSHHTRTSMKMYIDQREGGVGNAPGRNRISSFQDRMKHVISTSTPNQPSPSPSPLQPSSKNNQKQKVMETITTNKMKPRDNNNNTTTKETSKTATATATAKASSAPSSSSRVLTLEELKAKTQQLLNAKTNLLYINQKTHPDPFADRKQRTTPKTTTKTTTMTTTTTTTTTTPAPILHQQDRPSSPELVRKDSALSLLQREFEYELEIGDSKDNIEVEIHEDVKDHELLEIKIRDPSFDDEHHHNHDEGTIETVESKDEVLDSRSVVSARKPSSNGKKHNHKVQEEKKKIPAKVSETGREHPTHRGKTQERQSHREKPPEHQAREQPQEHQIHGQRAKESQTRRETVQEHQTHSEKEQKKQPSHGEKANDGDKLQMESLLEKIKNLQTVNNNLRLHNLILIDKQDKNCKATKTSTMNNPTLDDNSTFECSTITDDDDDDDSSSRRNRARARQDPLVELEYSRRLNKTLCGFIDDAKRKQRELEISKDNIEQELVSIQKEKKSIQQENERMRRLLHSLSCELQDSTARESNLTEKIMLKQRTERTMATILSTRLAESQARYSFLVAELQDVKNSIQSVQDEKRDAEHACQQTMALLDLAREINYKLTMEGWELRDDLESLIGVNEELVTRIHSIQSFCLNKTFGLQLDDIEQRQKYLKSKLSIN